jgi:hypothetical protein
MAILLNRRCSNELAGAKHAFPRQVRNLFLRAGGWGENRRGAGWSVAGASIPTLNSGSMKPLCEYCGTRHESYQAHVFATNTATNRNATNRGSDKRVHRESVVGQSSGVDSVGGDEGSRGLRAGAESTNRQRLSSVRTANRRDRVAYNAYQREYMRKKRALGRD